jgi:phage-related protein
LAADGSIKISTELDQKGLDSAMQKMGGLVSKGLQTIAVGITAASAAVGAVGGAALKMHGDVEQSIGGVNKLFKESADTVIKNSETAFQTAGINANKYMELTTSFSASLLAGLDGDTAEAARIADVAIRDISDNANTFGTDIESLQEAYKGFAKQQYMLLDNLKLGYGGTKTEMERLLADAQAISGVEYDIDNLGDVIQAINVIQTNLDITGTTAKEAGSTFNGAFTAAKEGLITLLSGMGDPQAVADAVLNFGDILINRVTALVPSLVETGGLLFDGIIDGIIERYPQLEEPINKISSIITTTVGVAGTAFGALIDNLNIVIPLLGIAATAFAGFKVVTTVSPLVTAMSTAFAQIGPAITAAGGALPALGAALGTVLTPILLVVAGVAALTAMFIHLFNTNDEFASNITTTWENIKEAVSSIITSLIGIFDGFVGRLADTGVLQSMSDTFIGIWEGIESALAVIFEALAGLVEAIFGGIASFLETHGDTIETTLTVAWKLIWSILEPILTIIGDGVETMGKIIGAVIDTITNIIKGDWAAAWKSFKSIFQTAYDFAARTLNTLLTSFTNTINNIVNVMSTGWNNLTRKVNEKVTEVKNDITRIMGEAIDFLRNIDLQEIGRNIIQGLINGIGSMASAIWNKASSIGNSIADGVKNALGIHSPSKVGLEIGTNFDNSIFTSLEKGKSKIKSMVDSIGMDMAMNSNLNLQPNINLPQSSISGANHYTNNQSKTEIIINLTTQTTMDTQADIGKISRALARQTDIEMRSRGIVPAW